LERGAWGTVVARSRTTKIYAKRVIIGTVEKWS
jgi:hypothetical protein